MVIDKIDPTGHIFVPKHILLNEKEEEELLTKYNISRKQLPVILITDPAIKGLSPKIDSIIKIVRKSETALNAPYYRVVVSGK